MSHVHARAGLTTALFLALMKAASAASPYITPELPAVPASEAQAVLDEFDRAAGPPARDGFLVAQQACMAKAQQGAKPPAQFQTPPPGSNPVTAGILGAVSQAMNVGSAIYSPGASPEARECFQKAQADMIAAETRQRSLSGYDHAQDLRSRLEKLWECHLEPASCEKGMVIKAVLPNKGTTYGPIVGTREVRLEPDSAWLARAKRDAEAREARNREVQRALMPQAEIRR